MKLTPTEKKKRALARLEQTNRACDGCGQRIGRWTSKCHYDARADRCYCSTGGCAKQVREAPICTACKRRINPFEDEMETFPGGQVLCCDCAGQVDLEDGLAGLERIDVDAVRGVSDEQRRWAKQGPYVAVRKNGFAQVVRPVPGNRLFVRSSGVTEVRAVELCARFNATA